VKLGWGGGRFRFKNNFTKKNATRGASPHAECEEPKILKCLKIDPAPPLKLVKF